MKLYVIPAIAALALAGCAALGDSGYGPMAFARLTPTVSQDGTQGFTFNVGGKASLDDPGLRALHEQALAEQLGRRQFCMKGYDLVVTEKHQEESGRFYSMVYTGKCK